MTYILNSVPKKEMLTYNSLIFNNILIGFNNFHNGILCCIDNSLSFKDKENLFINFFNDLLNTSEGLITDYHVNNLNTEGITIIKNNLSSIDINILESNLSNNSLYFKIEAEPVMNYITKLSTRELCFCTIYTKNKPISIWGNYNFRFPIFFEKESYINYYINLAKKHNLDIEI